MLFFIFACLTQLREARAEAEAAGEATRKDIEKLRGLHARRVKRLEALLKEEGENLADARREIGTIHHILLSHLISLLLAVLSCLRQYVWRSWLASPKPRTRVDKNTTGSAVAPQRVLQVSTLTDKAPVPRGPYALVTVRGMHVPLVFIHRAPRACGQLVVVCGKETCLPIDGILSKYSSIFPPQNQKNNN